MALKNQIIVYILTGRTQDKPPSLSFSTRTAGLGVICLQVSSSTRDEMKSRSVFVCGVCKKRDWVTDDISTDSEHEIHQRI
jgi:hypothetical protein